MGLVVYPDDRLAFIFAPQVREIRRSTGSQVSVYSDVAATVLAPIFTLTRTPISNSALTIGEDSLLPEFLAEHTLAPLWGRASHSTGLTYPIFPRVSEQITAAEARAKAASTPKAYAVTIGDGSTLTFPLTHGKGTVDVVVSVRQTAAPHTFVIPSIEAGLDPLNQVVVRFNTPPALNEYRVTVV